MKTHKKKISLLFTKKAYDNDGTKETKLQNYLEHLKDNCSVIDWLTSVLLKFCNLYVYVYSIRYCILEQKLAN